MPYGQQSQMFDSGSSNKDIAEKLRLASNKGLIDVTHLPSGPLPQLPPNTIKLLNNMLDAFTDVEKLEQTIDALKRNGNNQEAEGRQLELGARRSSLENLRDKVNSSLGAGQRPPQRGGCKYFVVSCNCFLFAKFFSEPC